MSKESMRKLTLSDLMARAEQAKADKEALIDVPCPMLGGVLQFKKLPLSTFLGIVDQSADNDADASERMRDNYRLIYKHCPMLQKQELQDAYNCAEPYDIVPALFEGNLGEIKRVADTIMGFYGLGDATETVKN